jgi:lysyl-tRNA synthetase class 1
MQWLNRVADEIVAAHPEGEILIESGGSPSGTYHLGHLRELIICDALLWELKNRGRNVRHIYYSDDLDALRKVPVNIPAEYEQYLGKSLCDIPAPDSPGQSYAEYFLQDLINACTALGVEVEFVHSHQKYRDGFFTEAIEKSLSDAAKIRGILESVSGHKLGEEWSPIQINEEGYLKKRRFVEINPANKTIVYEDKDGQSKPTGYAKGEVKLDWRIDWPARWWLLKVDVEPFGRDHATKGGSYDTGAAISKDVFQSPPPMPVPYDFVNLAGDSKKMSASKGTGLDAKGVVEVLPPEVVRFFMLRYPPSKRLYFDPEKGVSQLIDEFAETLQKEPQSQLVKLSLRSFEPTVSPVPFSHLVATYQSVLRSPAETVEALTRTHEAIAQNTKVIKNELRYIDNWLDKWAPDEVKFELRQEITADEFSAEQKSYLSRLADRAEQAPADAGGEWFHKAIYELKEADNLSPQQVFEPLYLALIGKKSGPRAGWFLSILPRDWLIERLRLEA